MKTNSTKAGAEVETVKPNNEFPLPIVTEDAPVAPPSVLGKKIWRSLEEKDGDIALLDARQDEFPKGAGVMTGIDRRGFLQLLGGSAAIAGAAACWRPPEENIYPYTKQPDNIPGVPQHYASTMAFAGYGTGVVVESYDGRPIKVEGNTLHPNSRGATTPFEQAQLYRLYDPHRAKAMSRNGRPQAWRQFLGDVQQVMAKHTADGGAKLRFLVQPTSSPSIQAQRNALKAKLPSAKFYAWSPVSHESERKGAQAAFGAPLEARYDLTRANVIVSLDSDFLYWEPERIRLSREYADRRVGEDAAQMNRLYAVESSMSLTGMQADHRLRVKPSQVAEIARALAAALAGRGAGDLGQFGGGGQLDEKTRKFVDAVAADLAANRGSSVVIAGFRQSEGVHALVHAINGALGNLGTTVTFAPSVVPETDDGMAALRALAEEIKAGAVETLVIDAYNPVFTAPADLDLAALFKTVPSSLYYTYYFDETAAACNWLVPAAHELESWGDLRGPDGTVSLVQPIIAPLFGGVPHVSLWAGLMGQGDQSAYDLVKNAWAARSADALGFEAAWRKALADGVVAGTALAAPATPSVDGAGVSRALQAAAPSSAAGELELNILPDYKIYDGSFGNVAWLQELPDPITKVTWENTATVSPTTAQRLGIKRDDLVKLTLRDRTVEAGVFVLPGHADDVVTVTLGWGRTSKAEELAASYGFNAYTLRFSDAPWFAAGLKLEKTGKSYELAVTQDHWSMEGRDMALMADHTETARLKEEIWRNRSAIKPNEVMQEPWNYDGGYKWGMAIDLSRCTSCNACVIACQAENNIPIVGKDQVIRAREMHWLMIDRYFVGDDSSDVEVVTQPRMCVHCETAPCEYVCPVNATVHSDEGLNDMVYNRCVGTRYCSNNCPYKVRRFNYLHWNYGKSTTEKMMMNPEVTVRARGVMEKCTYCTQRIERVRITKRIQPKPEDQVIRDGDVVTACQQACPTAAIVFGDLNDPGSRVTQLHQDGRRYDLLYSLGTRPRTGYLARIKNYNPALVAQKPATNTEHH